MSGQGTSSALVVWTSTGTHSVTASYRTTSGCTANKGLTVTVWALGLEDADKGFPVVFPNPVKDYLIVEFKNKGQSLKTVLLYDLLGREQIRLTTRESRLQIDVNKLLPGTYALKVEDAGLIYRKPIIKY